MNEVDQTPTFDEIYESCTKKEQKWIGKIKDKLKESLAIGKPLRYSWFREKKLDDKRLYFFINTDSKKAILVHFGNKKNQKGDINHLLKNKERYLKLIR